MLLTVVETTTGTSTRIYGEVLAGTINGVNTVFTTANDFIAGSEAVYFNGVRQREGVGNDFVRSESGGIGSGFDTITFAVPPRSRLGPKPDDIVTIDYDPA